MTNFLLLLAIGLLCIDFILGIAAPAFYYSHGLPIFRISRTLHTKMESIDLTGRAGLNKELETFVVHPISEKRIGLRDKMLRRLHTPVMRARLTLSQDGTEIVIVGFLYTYVIAACLGFLVVFVELGTWFAVIMGGIIFIGIYIAQAVHYRKLVRTIETMVSGLAM